MDEGRQQVGRRSASRHASVLATAMVLRRGALVGRFVVQDLSASGALLTGSHTVPPGDKVRVILQFPDHQVVSLDGRVVRHAPGGEAVASIAVTFRHRSDITEDLIQQEALTGLLRAIRPAVLIVSDRVATRRWLADRVESAGRSVRLACAPLDALRWLEDPSQDIDAVVVPSSLGRPGALTLLGFLADEYPDLRRILLEDVPRSQVTSTLDTAVLTGEDDGHLAELLA